MTAMTLGAAGCMAAFVEILNHTIGDTKISPATASSGYRLNSDGSVQFKNISGTWSTYSGESCGGGAGYECRATVVSGSVSSGTTGSWLALTSTRSWTLDQISVGTSQVVLTIEIRTSGGGVVDSATITLNATVEV